MSKFSNKVTLLNMLSSILLQICTMISGFIIPRVILAYFGSDVNGLISSITQFLSYISLVEGGIGSVVLANLYKPLVEHDDNKLSSVVVTANRFYKQIGLIFISFSVVLSIAYPIIFDTGFSFGYVCSLTLILSISTTVQYIFSINLRTLLNADKRVYIVSFSQIVLTVFNILLTIITVYVYPDVHVVKLVLAIAYFLQPIYYGWYVKRHYHINWRANVDNNLLKERWNGFAINFAAFVHNCTDIAVLTIFTDLKTVSVYSVYSIVTTGIKQLINSLINGLNPVIGQAYARGDETELNLKLDLYEYIIMVLTCFLYTITALLITPFVQLYTHGITDAQYFQPLFGYLLVLSEAIYIVKYPHLHLAYSANKFKEIKIPAYIEAGINIVVSTSLVYKMGLIGVAIGTVIAMLFRMAFHVWFTKKMVANRKQSIFYKKLLLFCFISTVSLMFGLFVVPLSTVSVWNWTLYAIIYSVFISALVLFVSAVFFKKEIQYIIHYMRTK